MTVTDALGSVGVETGWSWEILRQFENKSRPVRESHVKWESRTWSRRLWTSIWNHWHPAQRSQGPGFRWNGNVWFLLLLLAGEVKASVQAPFLWVLFPSGLLWIPRLAPSTAHSLDFTGISRHRNAFVGAASFAALKGGPGVPSLCPQSLELI